MTRAQAWLFVVSGILGAIAAAELSDSQHWPHWMNYFIGAFMAMCVAIGLWKLAGRHG